MNESILSKYVKFLEDSKGMFNHIRVTIGEDENYGEAIGELKDGTPSSTMYCKELGEWI